eukprot:1377614-Amorphochlora_amoeboformis.AAC.1
MFRVNNYKGKETDNWTGEQLERRPVLACLKQKMSYLGKKSVNFDERETVCNSWFTHAALAKSSGVCRIHIHLGIV